MNATNLAQEVVVGDIALIETGEVIPCDGIFLSGHNVICDESNVTGETDPITKVSYPKLQELLSDNNNLERLRTTDCFMISGARVIDGVGKYLVITVGRRTLNGRIMLGMCRYLVIAEFCDLPLYYTALEPDCSSALQVKLNKFSEHISRIGTIIALIFFIALIIRFFVQFSRERILRYDIPSCNLLWH